MQFTFQEMKMKLSVRQKEMETALGGGFRDENYFP